MSWADTLDILYEDNHCLAINKPVGWASAHGNADESLDHVVKAYLKEKYRKPGEVFLGVVHRLDKPVSGVLLFARTSKGASRLSAQFRGNAIDKVYWAVIEGELLAPAGSLECWIVRDRKSGLSMMVPKETPDAQFAVMHFARIATHDGLTWLEIRPQTGRRHQLRVQWSTLGHAIYGDKKYGSRFRLGPGIALHARSLSFLHPTRGESIELTAGVPLPWRGRFARLLAGGK